MADRTDTATAGPEARREVDERVRTPLLTLLTQEALEKDYQVAARKHRDGQKPEHPWPAKASVVGVVVGFGLLVALAAVQTSRNADVEDASRATLISRIETRQERVRELQAQIADLREENGEAQQELVDLGDRLADLRQQLTRLEVATGFVPVTGEGVRLVLDNAPYADPQTEHIRDSDLALLVNGLWEAGAEAVAINGQRLTVRSAIRNVGTVVEVNSIGVAPPYTVEAVGPTETLAADLLESSGGGAFLDLAAKYGFSYDMDNVDDLQLPAAPARLRQLRSTREAAEDRPGGEEEPL